MQRRFDEAQSHDRQVRRAEREGRRQRVDGAHELDFFAARNDSRQHEQRGHQAEHDDRHVRRLELRVQSSQSMG